MTEQGYLIIADITGYTAFLSQSELVHAEDALRDLFKTLLAETQPPLAISKLEGDAVFCYSPVESIRQGQTLVEIIEKMYVAFRQTRQRMQLNTTCTCQACVNIPNLDLKFFIHYGTYVFQTMGSFTELVGSDVNLLHRLTKNHVTETLGLRAYAMYTRAAVDALGIHDICAHMVVHRESYEHLGEVETVVEDMQAVWDRGEEERRIVIEAGKIMAQFEVVLPVGPALAWDYVTLPEYRTIIQHSDGQTITERQKGRMDRGTIYHCAHGDITFLNTILEWQPFAHYAWQEEATPRVVHVVTMDLSPVEGGTRAVLTTSKGRGPLIKRLRIDAFIKKVIMPTWKAGLESLAERVQAELDSGAIVIPEANEVTQETVGVAIAESLAQ